jgi:hypothetical protein
VGEDKGGADKGGRTFLSAIQTNPQAGFESRNKPAEPGETRLVRYTERIAVFWGWDGVSRKNSNGGKECSPSFMIGYERIYRFCFRDNIFSLFTFKYFMNRFRYSRENASGGDQARNFVCQIAGPAVEPGC